MNHHQAIRATCCYYYTLLSMYYPSNPSAFQKAYYTIKACVQQPHHSYRSELYNLLHIYIPTSKASKIHSYARIAFANFVTRAVIVWYERVHILDLLLLAMEWLLFLILSDLEPRAPHAPPLSLSYFKSDRCSSVCVCPS